MRDFDLETRGRWRSILPSLGVDAKYLTNRQGPCPICAGKTRFRFDDLDGRGTSYCNQCSEQRRSGGQLLMAARGWTFPEMKAEVMKVIGAAAVEPVRSKVDPKRARAERTAIWNGGHHDLSAIEPVRKWWIHRVGFVPSSIDLRATDDLFHPMERQRFPGMLARMVSPAGTAVQIHRTYLTLDGQKPSIRSPRLLMPAITEGEMNGAAVRLAPYTDHLGVAEGIETSVAATKITGIPCWATLNAGNLEKWVPPTGVRVTIFGDNDSHKQFTGELAAYTLANRLSKEGVPVELVSIPSSPGEDWNDVWQVMRDHGGDGANDFCRQAKRAA